MTIKERLVKFAKSKERSVRAFEREAGLTIGYVNTIRVSVQPDKLQRIASRYPDLNTEWLMTGVGPMTRGGSVKTSTATNKAETPNDLLLRCCLSRRKAGHLTTLLCQLRLPSVSALSRRFVTLILL